MRRRSKLFRPDTLERGAALFAALRAVADAHGATPAQVALAWAIRRPSVVAIPGASSVEQVESNAAAADLELHDDEIQALSDAATAVA
jgi:aryl-alcohol dehydrogenase-like predicted oxidoreductase